MRGADTSADCAATTELCLFLGRHCVCVCDREGSVDCASFAVSAIHDVALSDDVCVLSWRADPFPSDALADVIHAAQELPPAPRSVSVRFESAEARGEKSVVRTK